MKKAIITGITGQVGSFLAKKLLNEGYYVIGLKRRTSLLSTDRIDDVFDNKNFELRYWNLHDGTSIARIINETKPHEFYHLAAMSHVKVSFEVPEETLDGITLGTLRILEALRIFSPKTRFFHASTSEMYGDIPERPELGFDENTRMNPVSPYAIAKLSAHQLVKSYRNAYKMFCSNGIVFNNESEERGETFVTRKITLGVSRIKLGLQNRLVLGNLDAQRDWGFTGDYVDAIYKTLQHDKPDDFVIATGETHSVKDFLKVVFFHAGLGNWEDFVDVSSRYYRPNEVPFLKGNSTKARTELSWKPEISFEELAKRMFDKDLERIKKENNL